MLFLELYLEKPNNLVNKINNVITIFTNPPPDTSTDIIIRKVWQKEESARLHPNFFIYTGADPLVPV